MSHNWWIYVIVLVAAFIFPWATLTFVAYLQARKKDKKEKNGSEVGKGIIKGATFRPGSVLATIGIGVEVLGIFVGIEVLFPNDEWRLEGTVIDRALSRPIAGAEVTVMKFSTLTDDNGNYAVQYDGKPRPEWRVKFTREGYETLERTLTSDRDTIIFLETGHP